MTQHIYICCLVHSLTLKLQQYNGGGGGAQRKKLLLLYKLLPDDSILFHIYTIISIYGTNYIIPTYIPVFIYMLHRLIYPTMRSRWGKIQLTMLPDLSSCEGVWRLDPAELNSLKLREAKASAPACITSYLTCAGVLEC